MVEKQQYISLAGFPLINFPALPTALKATSPLYQLWFSKFVSGHSATGCMMYLWRKWDNALCPCCRHDPETTQHVLICPNPCMHLEYCSKVLLLEQWLSSVDTMPEIQFCLLQGLHMEQPSLFSPFASKVLKNAKLIQTWPESLQVRNDDGKLPLHIACMHIFLQKHEDYHTYLSRRFEHCWI